MDRASISNVQKVAALFRGGILPLPWGALPSRHVWNASMIFDRQAAQRTARLAGRRAS
ncbi:hypothetical protein [Microvirga yunnanensis]|uniref:hypothetical protein n=1 Tax=Microvirga yunnanensis TaxID=2953740 RepID=UPI0021C59E49|nr:hypothetical protein [Microvirga sp. HBU65207]